MMPWRSTAVAASFVLVTALAPTAGAQSAASADLSVTLEAPSSSPLVGATFPLSLTASNAGPDVAEGAFLSVYLPPELELQAWAASDPGASCSQDQPQPEPMPVQEQPEGGGSGAPGYYGGGLHCELGSMAALASTEVTLTVERAGARETYASASVGSTSNDDNFENNWDELFFEPDRSHPADLGVSLKAPKAPAVGATFQYTVSVTNGGPSRAENVTLGMSGGGSRLLGFSNDACKPSHEDPSYGGYFDVICSLGVLDPGASAGLTFDVERTSAWEVYGSAHVTASNFDENYENDYAWHSIPADPSVTSDLGISATGPSSTPLVGETFEVSFNVSNSGPSAAGDVWLSDHLTDGLEFVSVAPSDRCSYNDFDGYPYAEGPEAAPAGAKGDAYYPVSPGGLYCDLGSLAPGETAKVTITLTRTKARELWNSAWVSSSNHDPLYDNNYSDMQLAPDKSSPADLAATMEAPADPPVGSDFDILLGVTNQGPSQAENVTAVSYLPYGLDFKSVSPDACAFVDGDGGPQPAASDESRVAYFAYREIRCDFGSVPAGESRSATVTVTRTTEYEIWSSSWVETANYDENYENDYASIAIEGKPYPGACPAGGGSVEGSAKADTMVVGDCAIRTGAGNDSVQAAPSSRASKSVIDTGGGADTTTLVLNSTSESRRRFRVSGGKGNDAITLSVAPGAGNATVFLQGNRGNDTFVLDVAPGVRRLRVIVSGQGGHDTVTTPSKGGVAAAVPGVVVYGGPGRDILEGGDGNDRLYGGRSADRLFGGMGDDRMDGGQGRNSCRGGPGRDSSRRCSGRL